MKKLQQFLTLLLCCLFVALPLSGCLSAPNGKTGYTFTDDLGQQITVDNPQRVVALMQSFAEVWILAGGKASLVGVTEDAAADPELGLSDTVGIVGTYEQPNAEAILALDPDLVLLSAESTRTDTHVALKDTLSAAGIPAAYFSVTHFPDYLDMLKICTDITGNQDAYQKNGLDVQAKIDRVVAENKREDAPSTLFCITYSGGVRPQNAETMTGKMLQELGCHNILTDHPGLLQDFSIEKILEIDPDYIFLIPMGYTDASAEKALQDTLQSDPAWNSLSAVTAQRCFILPQEMFLYKPNAQWADSYAHLAGLLNG